LIWRKTSKALALAMHFLKHTNMGQQRRKFAKTLYMFSLSLPNLICKLHNLVKKSSKGKQKWNKTCVDFGFCPRKLNIPIKTR
jgi:hypothetical protein